MRLEDCRNWLKTFNFKDLFIEGLGWDNHSLNKSFPIDDDGNEVQLSAIAQKRGLVAFASNTIPDSKVRLKINRQLTKLNREHFVIYTNQKAGKQVWYWVRHEQGKPLSAREHHFDIKQNGDALIQKLNLIKVSMADEEKIDLTEMAGKTKKAFDVEKVTKRFYDRFAKVRVEFFDFIKGIPEVADREWYASVMLNRLMFVYFIQRKGFLDGDHDYLRNRLKACQEKAGDGKFHTFYRYFLVRLFHEGLGKRKEERKSGLEKILGKVPYLNGGIFDVHELESSRRYGKSLEIPDKAFVKIFDYFDQYQWNLDERPLRADNEINPDVLGYIFEKYINNKEMGAYYTKEDITEYISKNTIIPFLFDSVRAKCPHHFENVDGPTIWDLQMVNPDRYIYPAMQHGKDLPLPPEIDKGEDTSLPNLIKRRQAWNKPAPEGFGLPYEIWREFIARRERYETVFKKLENGEVRNINDFITYNLDIRQFAQDVIDNCDDPDLLQALWHSISNITILDPTGGSGAFLFAALNILEPLYEACLCKMQSFLDEWGESGRKDHLIHYKIFTEVLNQVESHPNRNYFILKSIILKNLYAVDIMEEAVEICKLRLFLKLAAQVDPDDKKDNFGIEPLPDIDFNIRVGNTLVGYATYDKVKHAITSKFDFDDTMGKIEERARATQKGFDKFRLLQTEGKINDIAELKQHLKKDLAILEDGLNKYLAGEYGVREGDKIAYAKWVKSHKPFHWFIQFHGILSRGGFDVIIGNPPYVSTSVISYLTTEMKKLKFPDIYALVLLRSLDLSIKSGRSGMIVPLSITFSSEFGLLRTRLCSTGAAWFSSYDNIPAAIFDGVSQRCTIWIGSKGAKNCFSTPMYRWRSVFRQYLMDLVGYVATAEENVATEGLPKHYSDDSTKVLSAIHSPSGKPHRRVLMLGRTSGHLLGFSNSARNFISVYKEPPPCLNATTLKAEPSSGGEICCSSAMEVSGALASLAGELFLLYWLIRGDGFHLTSWNVKDYLHCLDFLPQRDFDLIVALGELLHDRRFESLVFKKNAGKYVGNFNFQRQFPISRRGDLLVLAGLGLGRKEALDVFDRVQRVLAINESAGEKGIPDSVKAKFLPAEIDVTKQRKLFREIDMVLAEHYGFTKEELDFIINYDIKYRMGKEIEGD